MLRQVYSRATTTDTKIDPLSRKIVARHLVKARSSVLVSTCFTEPLFRAHVVCGSYLGFPDSAETLVDVLFLQATTVPFPLLLTVSRASEPC